jgi:hypothetical protein
MLEAGHVGSERVGLCSRMPRFGRRVRLTPRHRRPLRRLAGCLPTAALTRTAPGPAGGRDRGRLKGLAREVGFRSHGFRRRRAGLSRGCRRWLRRFGRRRRFRFGFEQHRRVLRKVVCPGRGRPGLAAHPHCRSHRDRWGRGPPKCCSECRSASEIVAVRSVRLLSRSRPDVRDVVPTASAAATTPALSRMSALPH